MCWVFDVGRPYDCETPNSLVNSPTRTRGLGHEHEVKPDSGCV